jgi:hypothetical protein
MDVLDRIGRELIRAGAQQMQVSLSSDFDPETGELVRIDYEKAYWHLLPQDFEALLKTLPDEAGPERVRGAIESDAMHVWHGPSPKESREDL